MGVCVGGCYWRQLLLFVTKRMCVFQAQSCVLMSWPVINIPAYLTGSPNVPNFLFLPGKSRLQ